MVKLRENIPNHKTSLFMPQEKSWLTRHLSFVGLSENEDGACYGVAHIGMQALLAKELAVFDDRVRQFSNHTIESLCDLFEAHAENALNEIERQILTDYFIWLQGIELYQNTCLYQQLFDPYHYPFNQHAEIIYPLIAPIKLDSEGGVVHIREFTGSYDRAGLIDYFMSLTDAFHQFQLANTPFALVLSSSNHTVSVGYDAVQKAWVYINANKLPSTTYAMNASDIQELAENVLNGFSRNGITVFHTSIHASNDNYKDVMNLASAWINSSEMIEAHRVTSTKAKQCDSFNVSWLYIAAKYGMTSTVVNLLNAGSDPNQTQRDTLETAVTITATMGHSEVIRLLLDNGGNPNQMNIENTSALIISIQNNHEEVVSILLEKNADPNQLCLGDNVTALLIAAQYGNQSIIRRLLEKRANPAIKRESDGVTPLYIASQEGHDESVELLLQYRADPNEAIKNGLRPIHIAANEGKYKVVVALVAGGAAVKSRWQNECTAGKFAKLKGNMDIHKFFKSMRISGKTRETVGRDKHITRYMN